MNLLYPFKALLGLRTVTVVIDWPKGPVRMTMPEKYLGKVIEQSVERGYPVRIERMT